MCQHNKKYICICQDCLGTPHNIEITKKEFLQDRMCQRCADNVWEEMTSKKEYIWFHEKVT
jgi:hypothetical protein